MNNENKILKTLKPVNKVLGLISIAAGIAAIVVLIMFNFADVFTIFTDEGTKYADGFSYPGYQSIFYGFGNMIIQGYTEAGFNFVMCLGLFLPLISCIVATVMLATNFNRRGTNKKRAIVDGIAAACLIFGGIILFNCDKFWISAAQKVTGSYTDYYAVYLKPAIDGELYFAKDRFPTIVLVVCIVAGVIKFINCASLLFQKYYARYVKKNSVTTK